MQEKIFASRFMERTLFVKFSQESFNYLTEVVFSLGQFWLDKVGKVRKPSKTVRTEFSAFKKCLHAVFTRKKQAINSPI